MADLEYRVLVSFATGGSLTSDVDKAHASAGHLSKTMGEMANLASEVGGHLVSSFQEAVEHAGHLAIHMAKMGAMAGVGAIAYGIGHLNAELEQAQIALGALANRYEGISFEQGFEDAGEQVKKMKNDIKTLPGDLGQLVSMMKAIAPPAEAAGAHLDAIRKLSGKTMMVGTGVMGLDPELAARGVSQLLSGRAGSHNILGSRLGFIGDEAKKLNAATPEKRLEMVNKELSKYDAASDRMGKGFMAQFTTLKDNIKYVTIAGATAPLFERSKKSLGEINEWFDRHGARMAQELGDRLAGAWDKLDHIVHEWWPTIVSFAKQLGHELEIIWDRFAPALKEAGEALKGALGDGTAMKDIGKILELYAVSKVAGGGSSIGKAIGGAAGAAVGGFGGAAVGSAIGDVGGAGMMFGAPGVAVEKAIEIGLVGAMKDHPLETAKDLGELAKATQKLTDTFEGAFGPALEDFALRNIRLATGAIDKLANAIDVLQHPMESLLTFTESAASSMGQIGEAVAGAIAMLHPHMNADEPLKIDRQNDFEGRHMLHTMGNTILSQNAEQQRKTGAGKGGGGTHVQKVEIVVNTNQDSNRVAEQVVKHIQNLNRHPKVSSITPNYSKR